MEQDAGEDPLFGAMCCTVGFSLITVITVLFPLCNTDEALG